MKTKTLFSVLLVQLLLCSPAFSADWLYTVRPGDNLWNLCLRYTIEPDCWRKLDKVNNVAFPRRLPPGFVVSFPVEWLKKVPTPVKVTFIKGDARIQRQKNASSQAVSVGDWLPIGTKIMTGEGHLNLLFGDGSTLQLEPNSELVLDTLSTVDEGNEGSSEGTLGGNSIVDSRLRLNKGAVKARVLKRKPASRFLITTPTAVAAVRGTEYRVSSVTGEKTLMRGEVFEGLVDVSAQETLHPVAAGFGIIAQQGKPLLKPRPLLPPPTIITGLAPQSLPAILRWQAVPGAISYQLDILNDNDNNELIQTINSSELEASLNNLAINCYRIRMRGIDSDELQGLVSQKKLCIEEKLAAPVLDANKLNYTGRYTSALTWQPVENAGQYNIQLSADAQFTQIIKEYTASEPQQLITGDKPLFIRIQVIAANGQISPYSNVLAWHPRPGYWPLILFGLYALAIF